MGKEIITREDVLALRPGETMHVSPDALVTERALEAAREAGVALERRELPSSGGSPGGPSRALEQSTPAPAPARPSTVSAAAGPSARHTSGSLGAGSLGAGSMGAVGVDEGCGLKRVIVTVVGQNRPGVLGEVATLVGNQRGDIYEISQRVHAGVFNLVLVVDVSNCPGSTKAFKDALEGASRDGDFRVLVQHERVFEAMHRV